MILEIFNRRAYLQNDVVYIKSEKMYKFYMCSYGFCQMYTFQ